MKKIILLSILFLLISCNSKKSIENYLTSNNKWIIDKMNYKKQDLEPLLIFDFISFNNNGECSIPTVRLEEGLMKKEDRVASWSLDGNLLTMKSVKEYMNGKFRVCFGKDTEQRRVFMVIKSKDLYLKAYRGLFNDGFYKSIPFECNLNF